MGQDYFVQSITLYNVNTGDLSSSNNSVSGINDFIGSADTDDGFWDAGDLLLDGTLSEYQGFYTDNGHVFLVFEVSINGAIQIRSPTAMANDPGYPSTTADIPSLTTTMLATCFASGTRITTPDGEAKVEDCRIGDTVLAADGRPVAVKWIGRQTLFKMHHKTHMQPVRIRAGALGNGLPHSDLTVTADHGMIVDGLVINASALINGDTIHWVPMDELDDTFTVYHIETENHDVILANGAASETFVDYLTRKNFDNYHEYFDLYGAERIIPEMPTPRISAARLVPETIRRRLGLGADVSPELRQLSA